jgi:NADH-quinone oxidoreductase subunit M
MQIDHFLIAVWGSARRECGAVKLALYSFVGSAMVLTGLIAAYVLSGAQTFDLLVQAGPLAAHPFPVAFQHWVFLLVLAGLSVPAGLVIAFGCAPGWLLGKLSVVPNSSVCQL